MLAGPCCECPVLISLSGSAVPRRVWCPSLVLLLLSAVVRRIPNNNCSISHTSNVNSNYSQVAIYEKHQKYQKHIRSYKLYQSLQIIQNQTNSYKLHKIIQNIQNLATVLYIYIYNEPTDRGIACLTAFLQDPTHTPVQQHTHTIRTKKANLSRPMAPACLKRSTHLGSPVAVEAATIKKESTALLWCWKITGCKKRPHHSSAQPRVHI